MKLISIVMPCYNEKGNILEAYQQVKLLFANLNYRYELIFIDNASTDGTVEIIKQIAKKDKHVKLIQNARNFGPIRSPYHGIFQCKGNAVILIASDLQEPVYLIKDFLEKWEDGYRIVVGMKSKSEESKWMFNLRKFYYNLISHWSDVKLINNFTGFGLYDRSVIRLLKKIDDPYPYFRGLICELGFDIAIVEYLQPLRKHGKSKFNLLSLYDIAMLGFTNHTKMPIRLASLIGYALLFMSLLGFIGVLLTKLIYAQADIGYMLLLLCFILLSSIQLIFIGVVGEYTIAILQRVLKRPLVIEKSRINFDTNAIKSPQRLLPSKNRSSLNSNSKVRINH